MAKDLIKAGDIVLIADSKGVKDIYSADGRALDAASPLAVLVNGGTASAAEVLSGALQDNGRATIAGERTFGKGLIQSVRRLAAAQWRDAARVFVWLGPRGVARASWMQPRTCSLRGGFSGCCICGITGSGVCRGRGAVVFR